jgi:hypothetical protein
MGSVPSCIVVRTANTNSLLALLRDKVSVPIDGLLEIVMSAGQVLQQQGEPIHHVYFPCGGIVSQDLIVPDDDSAVTLSIVGREGAVCCATELLGAVSEARWTVRMAGPGWRIPFAHWQKLIAQQGVLALLAAYKDVCTADVQQAAACHLLHDVESRLCRWMLHLDDRIGALPIPVTHAELAVLAGVRRTTVTQVAGSLQNAGIIANRRGTIVALDRFALESAACCCYRAMRQRRSNFEHRFGRRAVVPVGSPHASLAGNNA